MLVVGTGSSGCEIAAHLARGEAWRVRLAVRSGPLILSRRYFGVRLTYWSIPGRLAPDRLLQRAGPVLQRLAFGDLTHHGLPAPAPDHGLADQRHSRYVPAVDGELVQALRRGDVEVVAAVRRFDGADVELSDDAKLRPNAVIAATGYHPGLQRLAGHLDVLDENGLPRAVAPDPTPGLFFAGYRFSLAAGLPHFKTQARAIAKIARSL